MANKVEVLKSASDHLSSQLIGADVSSTTLVREFLRFKIGALEHEVFAVIHLDVENRVTEYVEMFRGTVSEVSVHPREVIKEALQRNSVSLILVHNHPSGSTTPSRGDEILTQRLKHACQLVDILVVDHLIVTDRGVTSMSELGLV